jgi:Protein of unknown function (DUF3102)/Temperature dependent protein affecting M2 dsRNA replication
MKKIISREYAKKHGLKRYFTGKPCSRGHIAECYVNGHCVECTAETTRKYREARKAKTGAGTSKAVEPINSEPINSDWRSYASKITADWQKAVESIIETSKLLMEAKGKVDHGDWLKLAKALPFTDRTAQMLMAIAANPVLSNANHGSDLPASWRALYELTKLSDQWLLGVCTVSADPS